MVEQQSGLQRFLTLAAANYFTKLNFSHVRLCRGAHSQAVTKSECCSLRRSPRLLRACFDGVPLFSEMGWEVLERTLSMARQQIERLDFADRSGLTYLRMDHEAEACHEAGFYFEFCDRCGRMAGTIVRIAGGIRDQFFGSHPTAASLTPTGLRFALVGVMVGIAGLAALLVIGWSEIGAGAVSATERRADPSSSPAAAPQVETQADRMEGLRRRGLELLRADFPEDEPSPPLARGDRLELQDPTIQPVMRVATAAGENEGSVALVPPLPVRPAANKPAEAKEKQAVLARPAHRHARRASRPLLDRVRVAHAQYVRVPREPQVPLGGRLQPNRAPPEDNNLFGWFTRLPEAIAPSSWKGGWEKLWVKENGG
jgi:hypothetical protein